MGWVFFFLYWNSLWSGLAPSMITVQSQSTLDLWHSGDPATGMATFILRTLYVITDPGNGQREAIFPEVRTAQSLEIVDFFSLLRNNFTASK